MMDEYETMIDAACLRTIAHVEQNGDDRFIESALVLGNLSDLPNTRQIQLREAACRRIAERLNRD